MGAKINGIYVIIYVNGIAVNLMSLYASQKKKEEENK